MVDVLVELRRLKSVAMALAGLSLSAATGFSADVRPLTAKPDAEPLRACPEYGPGFIRLPGTDVCLKASIDLTLEVKADMAQKDIAIETARVIDNPIAYYDKQKFDRADHRLISRVDPKLNFMTVSKIGDSPLISFVSLRSSTLLTAASARDHTGGTEQSMYIDQAWLKYMGFTAGRHASYFDFSPGYTYVGGYASQKNLNLLAYTYGFGSTGSVSLSVEDGLERRVQEGVWAAYSGQRLPDLVAQARFTPSWGMMHASAALHQITDGLTGKTDYGYALNTGVEYRQKWADLFGPSAADTYGRILLSGAYARGALDYLGIPRFGTDYVADVDGKIAQTSGYSAVLSYEHVWKPNFKTTIGYSIFALKSAMMNFNFKVSGSVAQIGAEYMAAPGLMVGAELDYYRDSVRGTYFGTAANRDTVGNFTGFAYIRRRI